LFGNTFARVFLLPVLLLCWHRKKMLKPVLLFFFSKFNSSFWLWSFLFEFVPWSEDESEMRLRKKSFLSVCGYISFTSEEVSRLSVCLSVSIIFSFSSGDVGVGFLCHSHFRSNPHASSQPRPVQLARFSFKLKFSIYSMYRRVQHR
jgi:hypothetical protein